MAQIALGTLTVPHAVAAAARDDLAAAMGYPALVDNPAFNPAQIEGPGNPRLIPNPKPPAAFIREQIEQDVRARLKAYRVERAQKAAAVSAGAAVDAELGG